MACQTLTLSSGTRVIVCGTARRRRCPCGNRATLLCDWKVPERRSGTCDAPLCPSCTTAPAPEKDLCPKHAAAWADRRPSKLNGAPQ